MTTRATKFHYADKKVSSLSSAFSEHSYLLLTLALVFGIAVTLVIVTTRLVSMLFASDKIEESFE